MSEAFDKAFKIVLQAEFSSPANALHKHANETGYTFCGLYWKYHKSLRLWGLVRTLEEQTSSIKELSEALYNRKEALEEVAEVYELKYWNNLQLDKITNANSATEIFVAGTNMGPGRGVKLAQQVVGAKQDGRLGPISLAAINDYDSIKFDAEYDKAELAYYKILVDKNPDFKRFINGWENRAYLV